MTVVECANDALSAILVYSLREISLEIHSIVADLWSHPSFIESLTVVKLAWSHECFSATRDHRIGLGWGPVVESALRWHGMLGVRD